MNPGILTSDYRPPSMPYGLLGRPTPVPMIDPLAAHPEATDWLTRVRANRGTVSPSSFRAVSDFCIAIDAAGIRDRFLRLNLFCGSNLAAALVPLYRGRSFDGTQFGNSTDTNFNFVAGDYAETGETGGLLGNANNKSLSTGVAGSNISRGDSHMCYYTTVRGSGGSFRAAMGASAAPNFYVSTYEASDAAAPRAYMAGISFSPTTVNPLGMVLASEATLASRRFFINGAADGAVNTLGQAVGVYSNDAITIFSRSGSNHSNLRMGGYSFGVWFSESQASAYYNAMQAFQTALARNK